FPLEKLDPVIKLAENCGWIYPCKKYCHASDKYIKLNLDERNMPHSLNDAAFEFSDGYSIYCVHGVKVPEYLIRRPEELTILKIQEEKNVEIRRIMIDIYGKSRYLQDSDANLIHKDK